MLFHCFPLQLHADDAVCEGEIDLESITGLTVMSKVPGSEKPGLQIRTTKRDFYFCSSVEHPLTVEELELWIPAILAAKEGESFVIPKDQEVLLEFSMNSEEEIDEAPPQISREELEAEHARKAELERLEMEREAELVEQERRMREDQLALGQIGRSWEGPKRVMLCRTLVRSCNFLSKERVRDIHNFSEGKHLVELLRGVGIFPVLDETSLSTVRGAANVQMIQSCLNAFQSEFPAFKGVE